MQRGKNEMLEFAVCRSNGCCYWCSRPTSTSWASASALLVFGCSQPGFARAWLKPGNAALIATISRCSLKWNVRSCWLHGPSYSNQCRAAVLCCAVPCKQCDAINGHFIAQDSSKLTIYLQLAARLGAWSLLCVLAIYVDSRSLGHTLTGLDCIHGHKSRYSFVCMYRLYWFSYPLRLHTGLQPYFSHRVWDLYGTNSQFHCTTT